MNVSVSPLLHHPQFAAHAGLPTELKRNQVLGGRRQDLMSRFSDKDHIFNSDSTLFRNVDPWLNGDDHTRRKLLSLALGQPRLLMHLNSHSMASGMGKKSIEPCFFQDFTPGVVHFPSFRTRPYRVDRSQLGLPHRLIHAAMHSRNCPRIHSTGHIRTITSEYNTVIHDYKSLGRNGLRGFAAVWQG